MFRVLPCLTYNGLFTFRFSSIGGHSELGGGRLTGISTSLLCIQHSVGPELIRGSAGTVHFDLQIEARESTL